jgi:dTDP-4-amino-4,6-dideoxygalactose transaminase
MLIPQQRLTLRISDILSGAVKINSSDKNFIYLKEYVPQKNIYFTGSGRDALKQILETLDVQKVGLPCFTCCVVLESIKNANKIPVFIDSGIIADSEKIKEKISEIDALVLPYNFGFLPDIPKIQDICKKNNVILIEDCSQALGAQYNGKYVGSFGDYSFYSFGMSKNIGFCGGLIASSKKLRLKNPSPAGFNTIKALIKIMMAKFLLNPHIYAFFHNNCRKKLQKESGYKKELNFSLSPLARSIILIQFKRYKDILEKRKKNAALCSKELRGVIDFLCPEKFSEPAWLYFCLIAEDKEQRRRLIKKFRQNNIEIQEMFSFKNLSKNKKMKLAEKAENSHITFALYRPDKEIMHIIKKIKKTLR